MDRTRHWRYQPPLDGLRTLAVAAVFAYHLDFGWATGGFLGVDTFFVLSGFLITSLLLNEYARDRAVSFTAFWARRARRLLPALFVVLLAVAVYAAFIADPSRLDDLRNDMFATLFYGANWRFIGSGQSYFALFTEASPLRHAWSLAIEEQFYLVWPLIVFGCLRLGKGSRRPPRRGVRRRHGGVGVHHGVAVRRRRHLTRLLRHRLARAAAARRGAPRRSCSPAGRRSGRPRSRSTHAAGIIAIVYMFTAFVLVHDTDAWMYRGGYLVFAVAVSLLIVSVIQPRRTRAARRALAGADRVARRASPTASTCGTGP